MITPTWKDEEDLLEEHDLSFALSTLGARRRIRCFRNRAGYISEIIR